MSRDIVVTTPQSQREIAAQEAADCIADGGGYYFRNLGQNFPKQLNVGGRVFYIEDGAARGFGVVSAITREPGMVCDTTNREFPPGVYVFIDAASWTWIYPIEARGFQGWRYSQLKDEWIHVLGGWLDPRPT